jgi:hypothetical protein
MFRRFSRLCGSDSPFRYGKPVKLSSHIRSKRFGDDVVLFANSRKIRSLASEIVKDIPGTERGSAFWEVYAKRFNESIHLLDSCTIAKVLSSFLVASKRDDLISGLCHFVVEDIERSSDLTRKYSDIQDLLHVTEILGRFGQDRSQKIYEKLVAAFCRTCYQIRKREDAGRVASALLSLKKFPRETSKIESILVKRLALKSGLDGDCNMIGDIVRLLEVNR